AALAVSRDRASNETRVELLQAWPCDQALAGRIRGKILNEHIGAPEKAEILCRWRATPRKARPFEAQPFEVRFPPPPAPTTPAPPGPAPARPALAPSRSSVAHSLPRSHTTKPPSRRCEPCFPQRRTTRAP